MAALGFCVAALDASCAVLNFSIGGWLAGALWCIGAICSFVVGVQASR